MLIRILTGDNVGVSGKDTFQGQAVAAGTANPSSVALGKECEQWYDGMYDFFPVAACSSSTFHAKRACTD